MDLQGPTWADYTLLESTALETTTLETRSDLCTAAVLVANPFIKESEATLSATIMRRQEVSRAEVCFLALTATSQISQILTRLITLLLPKIPPHPLTTLKRISQACLIQARQLTTPTNLLLRERVTQIVLNRQLCHRVAH